MRRLRRGDPLRPGITEYEEEFHYNYTSGGHLLVLSARSPTTAKIEAVGSGRCDFALSATDEAIFFLARFGELPWLVADYNWWINPPAMRPDPLADLADLDGGLPVNVCLVDASTGLVAALRAIRLSVELGSMLLVRVELQTRRAFNLCRYLELVPETRNRFREGREGAPEVLCACSPDWEFPHLLTDQTPHARH